MMRAARGYIDDVLMPRAARAMLCGKAVEMPGRKRGGRISEA